MKAELYLPHALSIHIVNYTCLEIVFRNLTTDFFKKQESGEENKTVLNMILSPPHPTPGFQQELGK